MFECVQSAKKQAEAVLVRTFTSLNNTHEKILDSDWLSAAQLKCNTSANYTSLFRIMIGQRKSEIL